MLKSKRTITTSVAALVVLLAPASLAFGQAGQNPKPPEPDDVVRVFSALVQTDVTVFDKEGRFVNNLRREDFELKIDGKPRSIEFFERVTAGSNNEEVQLAAARGQSSPTKTSPVSFDRGRTVVFFIDDFHLGQGNVVPARQLLLNFIEQDMGQNDRAIFTTASGQIGFLQQFTDNQTVLRAAIERIKARAEPHHGVQRPPMSDYQALQVDHGDPALTSYFVDELMKNGMGRTFAELEVKARAGFQAKQAASVTTNTLGAFESMVRTTSALPGRKIVFFISDGFFLDDKNSDAPLRVQRITSGAARNGVVIYSVDARGLVESLTNPRFAVPYDRQGRVDRAPKGELFASQNAMNALARDTGGRPIFNTNAPEVGVTKSLQETSAYYLLAWKPDAEAQTSNKFRRLSVSLVGHPELTLRVRQGFFDTEPDPTAKDAKKKAESEKGNTVLPKTPEVELRDAISTTNPNAQLPVALNLSYLNAPDKGGMLIASMQVKTEGLTLTNDAGKQKWLVNIGGTVFNDTGQGGASFNDQLTMSTESIDQLRKEVIYNHRVQLPPGLYQVRVGARDAASGKVGTAYEWIEIPDLSKRKLELSSLITGERPPLSSAASRDPNASTEATPRVDHRFHRNSVLNFFLFAYNAALSPADAKPDVGVQVQILRDKQPVITTPSRKISTEGVQQFAQLFYGAEISLEGLASGRYLLQISVADRIAKSNASQQMRFEIE